MQRPLRATSFLFLLITVATIAIDAPARADDHADVRLIPRVDRIYLAFSDTEHAQDLGAGLGAPIVTGPGYGLAAFASYALTELRDGGVLSQSPLRLHRFEAMLGGGAAFAPGWTVQGALGVAYASDLEAATWDAVQPTLSLMIHHVASDATAWAIGAAYTTGSPYTPLLPIIGFVHQAAGSPLRIDVLLPHHLRIDLETSPRLRLGLGTEARGTTWSVEGRRGTLALGRAGATEFAAVSVALFHPLRLEARLGVETTQYTLPTRTGDAVTTHALQSDVFAQLMLVVAP
jgi:hypothetical protein